ncbi:OprD family outer membrane porin [bacterium]|nr:OprD family outer membrane porin [bacterium]
MSLVAALLVGSSAFAIENVKVAGDAKLFYSTQDDTNANPSASLFDQSSSAGEASLNLGLTADLTEGVSAGATLNAITTLGLYNNLVSATWTGGVQDNYFFGEAWMAGTTGNTTGKIGRMQLDTPLVFSETWSVVPNTFEAAVVINTDLPDTTLVGAFVGQHNSAAALGGGFDDFTTSSFKSFYNGAYAIGAINNSYKPLTAQAWYFDAPHAAKAYWLQADAAMEGFSAGIQYTSIDWYASSTTGKAVAGMLGYEMKDTFSAKVSYSKVGDAAGAGANLAGSQSKLYTEAWWYYGIISQASTDAMNVTITAPVADLFDAGVYFTQASVGANDDKFTEATFEAAKSFGPLDAGVYYIYTKFDQDNAGDAYNTLQVYLTYNF